MKKRFGLLALVLLAPFVAFAQNATQLFALLNIVEKTLGYVEPIVIIIGVVMLLWAIFQFISNAGDEEARASAKQQMLYAILGLFVAISIWGLVGFLQNLLGIGGGSLQSSQLPCVINTTTSTGGC